MPLIDNKNTIELGVRFQQAFGFVSANYSNVEKQLQFQNSLNGATVVVDDPRSSFEEFTMRRPGLSLKFAFTGFAKALDDVYAPPPLIRFRSSKTIASTIVNSMDDKGNEVEYGEVVERYGRKPVEITMQGLLIDMVNHEYPKEKVRTLTELFDYNGIWAVEGQIWRDKKIDSIYISEMDDGGVQGYMDTWQFTLTAYAIKPVEYFLNKKSNLV